jgi:dihydroorotate dehydrogenase
LIRLLPAEMAHNLSIAVLKTGLVPSQKRLEDPILEITLWGMKFSNPIGLAAGYDKNAEVSDALFKQGFGFVEIGTVTPQPQHGNSKPRLFRLIEDEAVINQMGFNNSGMCQVAKNLTRRRNRDGIIGVNLGKNKTTENVSIDYEKETLILGPLSDYLVINVSSPNTPGLRALQSRFTLENLIEKVQHNLNKLTQQPPLLLKISPDLNDKDLYDIAEVAKKTKLDGLIVTNTTITRPYGLHSFNKTKTGGLSGAPLFELSTKILREIYSVTNGCIPLIGVGGITTGAQAYSKIRAGASLIQLYTTLIYHGMSQITKIKYDLGRLLRRDGFQKLTDAIGADHKGS